MRRMNLTPLCTSAHRQKTLLQYWMLRRTRISLKPDHLLQNFTILGSRGSQNRSPPRTYLLMQPISLTAVHLERVHPVPIPSTQEYSGLASTRIPITRHVDTTLVLCQTVRLELPYHDNRSGQGCYFCIQYNFNSGALLIVAMSTIRVGSTRLKESDSLLVMADTIIDCGGRAFQFMVEVPDLSQCADAHRSNYEEYVAKFKLQNVLYMATSREQDPPIGRLHRSKAVLGHGAYGEVHKAVQIRTGELCAIKMLPDKDEEDILREVKVLSGLSHVSYLKSDSYFPLSSDSQTSLNIEMHFGSAIKFVLLWSWLPMIFTNI